MTKRPTTKSDKNDVDAYLAKLTPEARAACSGSAPSRSGCSARAPRTCAEDGGTRVAVSVTLDGARDDLAVQLAARVLGSFRLRNLVRQEAALIGGFCCVDGPNPAATLSQ